MSEIAVDIIIRALVAAALGGLIGLERELGDHPAGIRTHILVTLGACVFTSLSLFGFSGAPGGGRVAAAVVTGIGFIGAGAILRSEGGVFTGLTTAASLWSCAAIGMLVGTGFFVVSIIVTVIVLLVLSIIDWLVDSVARHVKYRRMVLSVSGEHRKGCLEDIREALSEHRCRSEIMTYGRLEDGCRVHISFKVRLKAEADLQELTDLFYGIRGVTDISWE